MIIRQFQEQGSAENGEPYPTVLVYLKDENRTEEMNTSQYLKERQARFFGEENK